MSGKNASPDTTLDAMATSMRWLMGLTALVSFAMAFAWFALEYQRLEHEQQLHQCAADRANCRTPTP